MNLIERTEFFKVETTTLKFGIQTFAISHIHRNWRVESTFSFSIIHKPLGGQNRSMLVDAENGV